MDRYDVAIVGAGVAGLSLAWHLQKAGKSVVVLEKSAQAEGASTRNFGMVWVVGQADRNLEDLASRSKELWQQAAEELGFWVKEVGSLHLAYDSLEAQVLQEFLDATDHRHGRKLLNEKEALEHCSAVRSDGLLGALYSPTEAVVDPREVVHSAARSLPDKGVEIRFDCHVSKVETGRVYLVDDRIVEASKVVVCPGPDLFAINPDAFRRVGLEACHLQMLRLRPKSGTDSLGIHLCAGLTLGHYANFRVCPSLPLLKELHRMKWPRQVEHGIHVLVSEHADGTLTVGDSHVYGRKGPVYREEAVDEAILAAFDEFLPRENYEIVQRWLGSYNTHPNLPYWSEQVGDDVWSLNLFGTGMTLSFGVTELLSRQIV